MYVDASPKMCIQSKYSNIHMCTYDPISEYPYINVSMYVRMYVYVHLYILWGFAPWVTAKLPVLRPWFWNIILIKYCGGACLDLCFFLHF